MNDKQFDGGQLLESEKKLRDFYKRLLNFTIHSSALMGDYKELHSYNRKHTDNYNHRVFSFARWSADEKLIVIANFDADNSYEFELKIPKELINLWKLKDRNYQATDQLYGKIAAVLIVEKGRGIMKLKLDPLSSLILKIENR